MGLTEIVQPSVEILTPEAEIQAWPYRIERAGRTCYQSDVQPERAAGFCRRLIARGHESVLEHCSLSVRIVCDRATSHQLVRHRLASFSQESQRYVKHTERLRVIEPPGLTADQRQIWLNAMGSAHAAYQEMIRAGCAPEDARSVLPNATCTELVMSANLREWRHVFSVRCDGHAQRPVRELMQSLRAKVADLAPWAVEMSEVERLRAELVRAKTVPDSSTSFAWVDEPVGCLYMAAPVSEGDGEEPPRHSDPEQVPCLVPRGEE